MMTNPGNSGGAPTGSWPVRLIKRVRNWVYKTAVFVLNAFFLRNRRWYYPGFYGTDAPGVLLLKNLLAPQRLLTKLAYGRWGGLPPRLSRATPLPSGAKPREWEEAGPYVERLRADGVLFLPGRFAAAAGIIAEKYKARAFPLSDAYWRTMIDPGDDPRILGVITDGLLISIIARYYGSQPFLRNLPHLTVAHPSVTRKEAERKPSDFALCWHYDTVNLVDVHMLVSPVTPEGTRMQYARSSHRRHHAFLGGTHYGDYNPSHAYVSDHYEIIDLCGPPGTAVIVDSNGLHRMEPVKGAFRAEIITSYSPGNSILPTEGFVATSTDNYAVHPNASARTGFDTTGLGALQRRVLEKVAPGSPS